MHSLALLSLIVTFSFTCTLAHDNGMDMNMDQGMSMSMGNMVMYLHFTPGDNLWFLGWAPRTAGAMVGTCIGLFMLALAERWLSAMRAVMEAHWRTRFGLSSLPHAVLMYSLYSAQIVLANNLNTSSVATSDKPSSKSSQPSYDTFRRRVPPFILSYDVPRGIMRMALASIGFLFMLAVMTFQLGFIFSIVIGLGVGETLFGRYSPHLEHPH
ncbi:CTR copper uptake transporter [Lactarius hatsudake]|nr:CTR copper uptake transporter [Lactarius hatsudake]